LSIVVECTCVCMRIMMVCAPGGRHIGLCLGIVMCFCSHPSFNTHTHRNCTSMVTSSRHQLLDATWFMSMLYVQYAGFFDCATLWCLLPALSVQRCQVRVPAHRPQQLLVGVWWRATVQFVVTTTGPAASVLVPALPGNVTASRWSCDTCGSLPRIAAQRECVGAVSHSHTRVVEAQS